MSSKTRVAFLALAIVATMTSSAKAIRITNISDGIILFYEDFENSFDDVGTNDDYPNTNDPSPGTWSEIVLDEDLGGRQDIRGIAEGFAPHQGDKFMLQQSDFDRHHIVGSIGAGLPSDPNDLIRIEFAVRSTVSGPIRFELMGSGGVIYPVQFNDDGTMTNGGSQTQILGDWNEVVFNYVNGSNQISLSVNGASASTLTIGGEGTPANVEGLRLFATGPGKGYWDAMEPTPIPEPSSVTLLCLGGLALLRRRRNTVR